jgi:hypothetical protein
VGPSTSLVSICTPQDVTVKGALTGLEPAATARLELTRADWLERSISDLVAKIDRSSGRDHDKLVSLLINHEMALRSAARSEESADSKAARPGNQGTRSSAAMIQAARAASIETLRRAGLDADLAAVQTYLGESPADLSRPLPSVPEPTNPDRIRAIGRPFRLVGFAPGVDEPTPRNSLVLEDSPWYASGYYLPLPAVVALVLVAGIAVATLIPRRRFWFDSMALLMALGLAGYLGGPIALAGGLGLAAAGWKMVRQ